LPRVKKTRWSMVTVPLTKWFFGVRRQSEAATALWAAREVQERQTLPEPKRCRAPLATALQSSLAERGRAVLY
jgi:hypothetical protein